ncbi:putative ferric-chelate reductase 1 [Mytilus trossulus]|uniref:putative ferric-chelate reductase 1 n=1 Tax=Mytilus trossulus TaxID=6551 RepID=UPI003004CEEE
MAVIIEHLLLLFACCYKVVHGTSQGALDSSCKTMVPLHQASPQTGTFPFQITLDKTSYNGSDVIAVTLSKNSTNQFKGYLIQARNQDGTKIPGFALIPNSKFLQCDNPTDAVTHTEASGKDSVTFNFTAPANSRGNITIFATAVESKNTFWVKIPSETIIDMASTGASPTILPHVVAVTFVVVYLSNINKFHLMF